MRFDFLGLGGQFVDGAGVLDRLTGWRRVENAGVGVGDGCLVEVLVDTLPTLGVRGDQTYLYPGTMRPIDLDLFVVDDLRAVLLGVDGDFVVGGPACSGRSGW